GCLVRAAWGTYPEYHSSADSLEFVSEASLTDALQACVKAVDVIEGDGLYVNRQPNGEPQLGRRGLYRTLGGGADGADAQLAMLWVLNFSDGAHTLLDIAARARLPFPAIRRAADALIEAGLLSHSYGAAIATPRRSRDTR